MCVIQILTLKMKIRIRPIVEKHRKILFQKIVEINLLYKLIIVILQKTSKILFHELSKFIAKIFYTIIIYNKIFIYMIKFVNFFT